MRISNADLPHEAITEFGSVRSQSEKARLTSGERGRFAISDWPDSTSKAQTDLVEFLGVVSPVSHHQRQRHRQRQFIFAPSVRSDHAFLLGPVIETRTIRYALMLPPREMQ